MESVLRTAITDILAKLELPEVDFVVEHPAEIEHGDYATNIALVLAPTVDQRPRELAQVITEKLKGQIEYVSDIEIAGPGFINFRLHRDFFTQEIKRAYQAGSSWGSNSTMAEEMVVIEYTSPNLFKPLHVGNLVGNIIGESFARLYEFSGATVKRFNYPSDIGLTVAKGVWGLIKTSGDPHDITAIGEAYRVGNEYYEQNGKEAEEIRSINKALYEDSDSKLTALRKEGISTSNARLAELLLKLGTKFDHEITESEASEPGATIVREHIGDVFKESEGAIVFEGERYGLHTRVFLNSKGLPTYEAKDIGHFTLKNNAEPEWTHSIIVTGNEQAEYFKVVFAALTELYPELVHKKLEHIPTGFLTLSTGKMSSRKGNVLTGESLLREMEESAQKRATKSESQDVIEAVAVGALKYQILKHSTGSNIIFDKDQALSFEGDSGPYLQYTHARINSVLTKAEEAGVSANVATPPDMPYDVEKLLYQFPEVVEEALRERAPHLVTVYLTKLAGSFNTFYAHERIADKEDKYAQYKVAVALAVRQTLANGLWVLGIKAPEKM